MAHYRPQAQRRQERKAMTFSVDDYAIWGSLFLLGIFVIVSVVLVVLPIDSKPLMRGYPPKRP